MKRVHVVGAGLSGLTTAWHLADAGCDVTVFEAAAGPGGLIHTNPSTHGPVETAANAFVWSDTVATWFDRLSITPVFARDESKRRYIFRGGRPRRWPLTISESAVLAGRLGVAAASRGMSARDHESMAQWGDRVLGAGAREWLLEPAMQGIYATPASELSANAIFSGRRRGPRRMAAPSGGMGEFVTRQREQLVQMGVRFEFGHALEQLDPAVPTAVCTGAEPAARLLRPHAPDLATRLSAVRVAPLTTVTAFFTPHPADIRGFGVLFPAASGVQALGVLFNTDIFTNRGGLRSETWIVGDRGRGITTWRDEPLLAALANDREALTGRRDQPIATHISRWPRAIPVYDTAVLDVKNAIGSLPPWLALAGNYLGQIGVAALLELGQSAATRLTAK
jgi:oxygen-dependent protoporphyrinogen oxidase